MISNITLSSQRVQHVNLNTDGHANTHKTSTATPSQKAERAVEQDSHGINLADSHSVDIDKVAQAKAFLANSNSSVDLNSLANSMLEFYSDDDKSGDDK